MAFVAIGFQHIVANMFVIPAAIFAGALSWAQFGENFIPVFLGNAVGGAVFVGLAYHVAFFNTAARSGASSKVSGAQTPE
jgi:formate/nitrite transporter FocA (FNT family)